jgi:hypothetical protein
MVVIPGAQPGILPTVLPVKGNRRGIRFGNFKKNRASGVLANPGQQRRSHTAPPECGVDGDVENLRLIGRTLTPRAEPRGLACNHSQQQRVARVIAQRPLRGFRATVLDAGDGGIIEVECGPDQNGFVRVYHVRVRIKITGDKIASAT